MPGDSPTFDLILLGLGENGHTASLFPYHDNLNDQTSWTSSIYVKEQDMYRVTLMPSVVNRSKMIVFLVSGRLKAPVLKEVLAGPPDYSRLPAQLIRPISGELIWMADEAAAAKLPLSVTT